MTLADFGTLARRHGLDAIEVRALARSLDLPAVLAAAFGTPAALAEWQHTAGLPPVLVVGTSLKLVGGTEADWRAFLEVVPWAEAIGARYLRVFDGDQVWDATERTHAKQMVARWRRPRHARRWAADIIIETHDSLLTGDWIAQVAEATGAGILWDAHHTWRRGGESPGRTWTAIKRHVRHVHVKDSVRGDWQPAGYSYVLPGAGEYPIGELSAALHQDGCSGAVSLEWERFWHPELASLETALSSFRAWLAQDTNG